MTTTDYCKDGDSYRFRLASGEKVEGRLLRRFDSPSRGRTVDIGTAAGHRFIPESAIESIDPLVVSE